MPFNLLSKFVTKQCGVKFSGGAQATWGATFTILLIALLILFIKVVLVHWAYNQIIPNLFNEKYRHITMLEALYLVILIQSLFN